MELFYLMAGHALADFPLQAGPMAIEKSRHSKTELQKQVPWHYWLTAHAFIHGGIVALVTNSLGFGLIETGLHWVIDFAKCEGLTNIHTDQALHVGCRVAYWLLLINGVTLRFG